LVRLAVDQQVGDIRRMIVDAVGAQEAVRPEAVVTGHVRPNPRFTVMLLSL
jgi:hypothetical protein